jgi:parallel beta-helix repeat protein
MIKKSRLVSILIVLIIISPIGFEFDWTVINNCASAAIITVNDDGGANYTSIQGAIDNATNGDTIYIWEGIYHEKIVVDKSISIIGNGTGNTSVMGNGTGSVIEITADGVNITGLTINGSGSGNLEANLKLEGANNCLIQDVVCSNNGSGIILNNSNNNNLYNVTCSSTINSGITLYDSEWNSIQFSTCNKNGDTGIDLIDSHNNTLSNNTCNQNYYYGIFINGDLNTVKDNTCNSSTHNNFGAGIYLYLAMYNYVERNTCLLNTNRGIYLRSANFNTIIDNNCSFSTVRYGIYFEKLLFFK